jgi:hypothetical protein
MQPSTPTHVGQFEADDPIVDLKHQFAQCVHHPKLGPLLAPRP